MTENEVDTTAGDQLIHLTHVQDVCEALLLSLNSFETGKHLKYSLPSEKEISVKEVFEIVKSLREIQINIGKRAYSGHEVMKPAIGKTLPGWKAKTNLVDGLKEVLNV